MSKSNEDIVRAVTERVLAAMGSAAPSPKPRGYVSGQTCNATSAECSGSGKCATNKNHTMKRMVDLGAVRFSARPGMDKPSHDLARRIDHTLLKPDATREELEHLCAEARAHNFATVCVNSSNVARAADLLKGSSVRPIAVVGFPLGAATSSSKVYEAIEAIRNGAREIDMVINIGALKSKDYKMVLHDIQAVVEASKPHKVKVILETASLTQEEKVAGCVLSKAAGAAFVKTSTGFGPGGATVDDIALMRKTVGEDMEVKASGGIRSREDALKMIDAGADRIGASASVAIVEGRRGSGNY